MYTIKVDKDKFDKIKNNVIIYEFMINKDVDMIIGDHILFKKKPELFDGVLTRVTNIKTFPSIKEMATALSLEELGFAGLNCEEVEKICNEKFDSELIKKHGILVCRFVVTD